MSLRNIIGSDILLNNKNLNIVCNSVKCNDIEGNINLSNIKTGSYTPPVNANCTITGIQDFSYTLINDIMQIAGQIDIQTPNSGNLIEIYITIPLNIQFDISPNSCLGFVGTGGIEIFSSSPRLVLVGQFKSPLESQIRLVFGRADGLGFSLTQPNILYINGMFKVIEK